MLNGFGGLGVACWPLVPKFAGSNPDEAVGFLGRKNPSFGGEVKPSVPCRRFAACKRSLNLSGSRNLGKITGQFLAHSSTFRSRVVADVETPGGESGNSKGGGNQCQTTPKNLLRMQCARAIPVT